MRERLPIPFAALAAIPMVLSPAAGAAAGPAAPEPVEPAALSEGSDASARPAIPDYTFQSRVREQVARVWGVDSARIRLSWGYVPREVMRPSATFTKLLGRGLEGWFAVVCRTQEGLAQCLRVRAGVVDSLRILTRPPAPGELPVPGAMIAGAAIAWGPPAGSILHPITPATRPLPAPAHRP